MSDEKFPLVSFIMSVYAGNDAAELKRALESAVRQDYPAVEVALVIDGPVVDEIHQVIDEIRGSTAVPIRTVSFAVNQGLGRARNQAISIAEGDFLALADADDYSMPDRVRVQVEYLLAHPETDVVGCPIEEVLPSGEVMSAPMPLTHEDCYKAFCYRNPINHPTAMFRRRFFEKSGPYRSDDVLDEDSALWLEGMKRGCVFANIPDAKYRVTIDDKFFLRRKRAVAMVFKVRKRIISEMGYGFKGYAIAPLRAGFMMLPVSWLRKAYRVKNLLWKSTVRGKASESRS